MEIRNWRNKLIGLRLSLKLAIIQTILLCALFVFMEDSFLKLYLMLTNSLSCFLWGKIYGEK